MAIYDFIATSWLPLMTDLVLRLAQFLFAPWWPGEDGDGPPLGLGLADLLVATVFPLTMGKAFGHMAGVAALVATLLVIGILLAVPLPVLPAIVPLGPLMLLQYGFWRRRKGSERTTQQDRQEKPHQQVSRLNPSYQTY